MPDQSPMAVAGAFSARLLGFSFCHSIRKDGNSAYPLLRSAVSCQYDHESEMPSVQGPADRRKRQNLPAMRRHRRSQATVG